MSKCSCVTDMKSSIEEHVITLSNKQQMSIIADVVEVLIELKSRGYRLAYRIKSLFLVNGLFKDMWFRSTF